MSYDRPEFTPLSREAEIDLARRAAKGDKRARDRLIGSAVRWGMKIAHKHKKRVPEHLFDDLVQEALRGIVIAADKYDGERGIRFCTYATFWIKAKITRFIENTRFIRITSDNVGRSLAMKLPALEWKLSSGGDAPTDEEIAQEIGDKRINAEDIADMRFRLHVVRPSSLDAPLTPDAKLSLKDVLQDEQMLDDTCGDLDLRAKVHGLVDNFLTNADERTRVIVRNRIYAEDPEKLHTIGRRLGITRERVRQLETKILGELREYLEDHLVDEEMEEEIVPKPKKMLTVGKVTKLLVDWSKETGIPRDILAARMKAGKMTPEEIISTRYVPWDKPKQGAKPKPPEAKNICVVCLKNEATVKVNPNRVNPSHCESCAKKAEANDQKVKAAVVTSLAAQPANTPAPSTPLPRVPSSKNVEKVRDLCRRLDEIESNMKELIQMRSAAYEELNALLDGGVAA